MQIFRSSIVPAPASKLSQEDYSYLAADIATLHQHLSQAVSAKKSGVNVLIYGAPGSGKSEFVRMLAQSLGQKLYEVASENGDHNPMDGDSRFRAFRLAQSLLSSHKGALILFDEVEDVFRGNLDILRSNRSGQKAWVNQLLESNAVPAFWLSNNIYCIDDAAIRRFDYVLEMNAPPKRVREGIIECYLADLPVSPAWKKQWADHEALVPAVVERAARVVRSGTANALTAEQTEKLLDRTLGNTLQALRLPRKATGYPKSDTRYRLDILNADCDVQEICTGLVREQRGRLCLYGPSGTGKTAFGRYVADALDRPLHVKRASDILSPYLGVAEKNMAKMFRVALEDNAVLLLDEADTYLQDRRGAHHSWEVSQVNEMLTQLEAFDGIFLASTNLMGSLDEAALRRFDLKIRFDYLKLHQAWAMFADTMQILGVEFDEKIRPKLVRLALLTPGDFAAIVRQARLRKVVDGEDLYRRLLANCSAKPEGLKNAIGF